MPAHAVSDGEHQEGDLILSSTQFTTSADMTQRQFYYHTQYNRRVRVVDLNTVDFAALGGQPRMLSMDPNRVEDIESVNFGR